MKINKNILIKVMTSKNIPQEYAKVLYDWEKPLDGGGNPSTEGYVYNNMFNYSEHILETNGQPDPSKINISVKPGIRVAGTGNLVLSNPPSGNFNGDALMSIGNKVEYQDWTLFLNFEEASGEDGVDLGKSKILISSMQGPDSSSGFMIGINGSRRMFCEYRDSNGDIQVKSLSKKLSNKNLISASYSDNIKKLTLGIYDPVEKKGTYNSYTIDYTKDERWYIGGTKNDLTNNNNYKQFNGYIDNFLLLSGYLDKELTQEVSDVFFLTGYTPVQTEVTQQSNSLPEAYVETQTQVGEIVTGYKYVAETFEGQTIYNKVSLMGPKYETVGTYTASNDSLIMQSSAFASEIKEYDDAYIQTYVSSSTSALLIGNDLPALSVPISSADTPIQLPSMSNASQIVQGDIAPSAMAPVTSQLTLYKGEGCDPAGDVYFYAACAGDQVTVGNDKVVSLIPITSLYSPSRPLDNIVVTSEECARKSADKVTLCAHRISKVEVENHPSSLIQYVFYGHIQSCMSWPCPGGTTPAPAASDVATTTSPPFNPNAESYWGYDTNGDPVSFRTELPEDTPFAGYPNWITAGQYVRIQSGSLQKCVRNVQLSNTSINTQNYLRCDGDSLYCIYDDVAVCVNTTLPPPVTTTLPPKPCKYDITASLNWTNGLDLDIYVKTSVITYESCSADGDNIVFWGNKNYTTPYNPQGGSVLGYLNLNHDAYPSCNLIEDPLPENPPETIAGTFYEPRTFQVWWNRHSICTQDAPDVNAVPEGFTKTITIKNDIELDEVESAVHNELINVKITTYDLTDGTNIGSTLSTSLGGLDDMGDGTWEKVFQMDKGETLLINDIPQVVDANGDNIGGDQHDFSDGLKIYVYGCDCGWWDGVTD
jgi:hypothetical protein